MVTTQDRITRDDMHWWAFVNWLLKHDKTVIVLDDPTLNLTDPNGRLIAGVKATQAANYRLDVKKKALNAFQHHRDRDLWAGGVWPFGYQSYKVEYNGKTRFRLRPDPITSALVREAYNRIVNLGQTLGQIVRDWNRRGVMTGMGHQRHMNALNERETAVSEVRGTKWHTSSLRSCLSRSTLMGYAMHKGEVLIRDGLRSSGQTRSSRLPNGASFRRSWPLAPTTAPLAAGRRSSVCCGASVTAPSTATSRTSG